MPSYISNSKSKKRLIWIVITIVLVFLVSNFYLYHHFYQNTTKTTFISNMQSKKRHMALNLKNEKPKDAIFIGNSRTLYQISTKLMAEHGFAIYNFGVSGHETADFPSMIKSALQYHPKAIVICLAAVYFHNHLSKPKNVDLSDIATYIKTHQKRSYIRDAIARYVESWFLINTYATNINIRIRSIYQRLSKLHTLFHLTTLKSSLKNPFFKNKTFHFNKKLVKCHIFRTAYPKGMHALGMCSNGDGVLVGSVTSSQNQDQHLPSDDHRPINASYLRLFNYLLTRIKQHGVKPIVIFTPVFHNHDSASYLKKTAAAIHAPVIDLTNLPLKDTMWENAGHLNIHGRYYYTLAVAKALRKLQGNRHDKKHF